MKIFMRLAMLLALAAQGCGGGADPTLDGDWISQSADGTSAVTFTFKNDGSYAGAIIVVTSSGPNGGTVDVELETGAFSSDGSTIYLTPQQWSCPSSDPPYSIAYSLSGSQLVTHTSTGLISFTRNNSPGTANVVATFGCFASGAFVPGPLAPVMN